MSEATWYALSVQQGSCSLFFVILNQYYCTSRNMQGISSCFVLYVSQGIVLVAQSDFIYSPEDTELFVYNMKKKTERLPFFFSVIRWGSCKNQWITSMYLKRVGIENTFRQWRWHPHRLKLLLSQHWLLTVADGVFPQMRVFMKRGSGDWATQ